MEYKNEKHKLNCERWEFVRNLTKEENEELGYKSSSASKGLYMCKTCGKTKYLTKQSFKNCETFCENKCYGVINGRNHKVIKENCIASTHPHLVKYFVSEKDVEIHTVGSSKKVDMQCPECGHRKKRRIVDLKNRGISCICGDGFSYPEKFFGELLKQLQINFDTQFTLDGMHRYDFHMQQFNMLIEINGLQHYENKFGSIGGRTLKEEKENDRIKMKKAMDRGYNYIVLDCRHSELNWIRDQIMSSSLPQLLGFDKNDIDWIKVEENSRRNLVKEVSIYYNEKKCGVTHLGKKFNLSPRTVIRYLKQGNEVGWCNYQPRKMRVGKRIKGIHKVSGEAVMFSSVHEASKWLGKNPSHIFKVCNKERKSAYGYVWSYIDEEEINNQSQSNQNT